MDVKHSEKSYNRLCRNPFPTPPPTHPSNCWPPAIASEAENLSIAVEHSIGNHSFLDSSSSVDMMPSIHQGLLWDADSDDDGCPDKTEGIAYGANTDTDGDGLSRATLAQISNEGCEQVLMDKCEDMSTPDYYENQMVEKAEELYGNLTWEQALDKFPDDTRLHSVYNNPSIVTNPDDSCTYLNKKIEGVRATYNSLAYDRMAPEIHSFSLSMGNGQLSVTVTVSDNVGIKDISLYVISGGGYSMDLIANENGVLTYQRVVDIGANDLLSVMPVLRVTDNNYNSIVYAEEITGVLGQIVEAVADGWDEFVDGFNKAVARVQKALEFIVDMVLDLIRNVINDFMSSPIEFFKKIIQSVSPLFIMMMIESSQDNFDMPSHILKIFGVLFSPEAILITTIISIIFLILKLGGPITSIIGSIAISLFMVMLIVASFEASGESIEETDESLARDVEGSSDYESVNEDANWLEVVTKIVLIASIATAFISFYFAYTESDSTILSKLAGASLLFTFLSVLLSSEAKLGLKTGDTVKYSICILFAFVSAGIAASAGLKAIFESKSPDIISGVSVIMSAISILLAFLVYRKDLKLVFS